MIPLLHPSAALVYALAASTAIGIYGEFVAIAGEWILVPMIAFPMYLMGLQVWAERKVKPR
jgi:hypothetical protein